MTQLGHYRKAVAAWFAEHSDAMGPENPNATDVRFNPGSEPFENEPADDAASSSGSAPAAPSPEEQMLGLERTLGMLRAQLHAARYPEWLYELPIRRYEALWVQRFTDGQQQDAHGLEALVTSIEQERQELRPDLLPLHYVLFQAINAPMSVIFRSQPPGGRVWIITQLRFEVCRTQFKDPYDRLKCTKWRETDPANPMTLSGTYVYQVGWTGRASEHGTRTVEHTQTAEPLLFLVP